MILRQSKTKRIAHKVQQGTTDFFRTPRNVVGLSLAVIGAAGAVGYYQGREAINGKVREFGRRLRHK